MTMTGERSAKAFREQLADLRDQAGRLPCIYRDDRPFTQALICGCQGEILTPVFKCVLFGRCLVAAQLPQVPCCRLCPQRTPSKDTAPST